MAFLLFLFLSFLFQRTRVDHKMLITALRYTTHTHTQRYKCIFFLVHNMGVTMAFSRALQAATMAQRRCKCPKKVAATK